MHALTFTLFAFVVALGKGGADPSPIMREVRSPNLQASDGRPSYPSRGHIRGGRPPTSPPPSGSSGQTPAGRPSGHTTTPSTSYGSRIKVPKPPVPPPGSAVTKITLTTAPASQKYIRIPATFSEHAAVDPGKEEKSKELYEETRSSSVKTTFVMHNKPATNTASFSGTRKLPGNVTNSYSVTDVSQTVLKQSGSTWEPSKARQSSKDYTRRRGSKISSTAKPSSYSALAGPANAGRELDQSAAASDVVQLQPQVSSETAPQSYFIKLAASFSSPDAVVIHPSYIQGESSENNPTPPTQATYEAQTSSGFTAPSTYQSFFSPNTYSSDSTGPRYSYPDPYVQSGDNSISSETHSETAPAKLTRQVQNTASDSDPQTNSKQRDARNYVVTDAQQFIPVYASFSTYSEHDDGFTPYFPPELQKSNSETAPPQPQQPSPTNPQPVPANPVTEPVIEYKQESEEVTPAATNSVGSQSYIISSDAYPQNQGHQVVRFQQTTNGRGNHKHEFETTNGIRVEEETELTNTKSGDQSAGGNSGGSIVKRGSYSWIAPDGRRYEVRYTADAFGFHPEGDHIPKNLPVG